MIGFLILLLLINAVVILYLYSYIEYLEEKGEGDSERRKSNKRIKKN